MRITKQQREWCKALVRRSPYNTMKYDMAGRLADAGLVTIHKQSELSRTEWPYGNWRLELTEAGREVGSAPSRPNF